LLTVLYTLLVVSILVFGADADPGTADAAVTLLGENATPEAPWLPCAQRLGLGDPACAAILGTGCRPCCRAISALLCDTDQPVGPAMFTALGRSLMLGGCSLL